ncbi:CubicO group peptidase, beta-lactamase class C family [Paenibacillus sophorae]|uniref:Beta-lactamase family protein n=1 Tax=Paenibacillus sophorae TaxID=1333845 RepID=A0A1H8RX46_9BACL|nr:serine hydrolase [Paenibacillus sophorae]QWU16941.1 beta-lactamase family protein [Paenibacillus sophorae]SEO70774.1 CubicO group peptidase, beta-lactamase class C family [Paenibacillus sophorae]
MINISGLSAAIAPLDLRSCLISQSRHLQHEHYRDDRTRGELARINSCTKSLLSASICIAMDQGIVPPAHTKLSDFFPQLTRDHDPRKAEITLEHLLTMTAGWDWDEFGGRNSFPKMTRSPHWVQYVLEQQLENTPGTRMVYNSGNSQLLSAILVMCSGMSTAQFTEQHLLRPLGIEEYEWEQDPQGVHTGGFGMKLRPIDLWRFGQLYLQQGMWEGRQLISRSLVRRSVSPAVGTGPPRRGSYGWHWWTDRFPDAVPGVAVPDAASNAVEYFYARGYGGQFVYCLPELDVVVVITQDQQRHKRNPIDVFRESIAPVLVQG